MPPDWTGWQGLDICEYNLDICEYFGYYKHLKSIKNEILHVKKLKYQEN